MGLTATGERAGKRARRTQRLGGREVQLGPRCAAFEGCELVGKTRCERCVLGERPRGAGAAVSLCPASGQLGRDRFARPEGRSCVSGGKTEPIALLQRGSQRDEELAETAREGVPCQWVLTDRPFMLLLLHPAAPCTLEGMIEHLAIFGVASDFASLDRSPGTVSRIPRSTHSPPALRAAWGGLVPGGCRPRRTSSRKSCFEHQYRGDASSWLAHVHPQPGRQNGR